MTKEQIILELGKPYFRPILFAKTILILAFFISPFLWIWVSWSIAWKIFLTGLIGIFFTIKFEEIVKNAIRKAIENPTGKLKERLDMMQGLYNDKLNNKNND